VHARRLRRVDAPDLERVPHLAACLEPGRGVRPPYVLELDVGDEELLAVGVDAVGATEEVLVRALSPLAGGIGPYSGAIVRGDGSIHLAIDAHALAPRLRALGRVSDASPNSSRRT
jgi:chemotaxis protein histidine kinase CheA